MKVLCLIDGLGSGGAQRQLVGLASLLKKEGYDVLVVYYHGDHFFVPFLKEKGEGHQPVRLSQHVFPPGRLHGVYQLIPGHPLLPGGLIFHGKELPGVVLPQLLQRGGNGLIFLLFHGDPSWHMPVTYLYGYFGQI